MTDDAREIGEFDFGTHSAKAVERYRSVSADYEVLAETAKRLLAEMLTVSGIRPHSIEARSKSLESFSKKAGKPSENDPQQPKYRDPLREITDLAGVRVI